MREALKEAARLDMPVFAHCEEKTISRDGIVNECDVAKDLNMPQIPVSAEDVGTARETALLMSAPKNARFAYLSRQYGQFSTSYSLRKEKRI